jgi:rare lipoprotein A
MKGLVAAAIISASISCAPHTQARVVPVLARQPVLTFVATAYCRGTTTRAGTRVGPGVIAADPAVLPIGTQVRISGMTGAYDGIYTVMDTGPRIRGRRIDLYVTNCAEAVRFGRQHADLVVLNR